MAKTKIIFIDENDLPPNRVFGKAYRLTKSWVPWAAIEQIPKGMALELTPWLDGRTAKIAGAGLQNVNGRLRRLSPHLHIIIRGPCLFVWNPSDAARTASEELGHWRMGPNAPRQT